MALAIEWTDAMDARLLSLRRAGMPWDQISVELRVGRNSVIERCRRLGIAAHEAVVKPPAPDSTRYDRGAESLPPGHPISWEMLAAMTPSIDAAWPSRHA